MRARAQAYEEARRRLLENPPTVDETLPASDALTPAAESDAALSSMADTTTGVAGSADLSALSLETKKQLAELFDSKYEKMQNFFRRWDSNGDGMISKKEFKRGLDAIPQVSITSGVIDELFTFLDADRSGSIQPRELSKLRHRIASTASTQPKENTPSALDLFVDSSAAARKVVAALQQEEAEALFRALDAGGTGTLSYVELGKQLRALGRPLKSEVDAASTAKRQLYDNVSKLHAAAERLMSSRALFEKSAAADRGSASPAVPHKRAAPAGSLTTRVRLKVRQGFEMSSDLLGELPVNTFVRIVETRTLSDGARRARVAVVSDEGAKRADKNAGGTELDGWVSCVGKDGHETMLVESDDDDDDDEVGAYDPEDLPATRRPSTEVDDGAGGATRCGGLFSRLSKPRRPGSPAPSHAGGRQHERVPSPTAASVKRAHADPEAARREWLEQLIGGFIQRATSPASRRHPRRPLGSVVVGTPFESNDETRRASTAATAAATKKLMASVEELSRGGTAVGASAAGETGGAVAFEVNLDASSDVDDLQDASHMPVAVDEAVDEPCWPRLEAALDPLSHEAPTALSPPAVRVGVRGSRSGVLSARRLTRSMKRLKREMLGIVDDSAEDAAEDLLPDDSGEALIVNDLASPAASARIASLPPGPQSAWERGESIKLGENGGSAHGVPGWEGTQWNLAPSGAN